MTALIFAAACGSADLKISGSEIAARPAVAQDETLALIAMHEGLDPKLRDCVEAALRENLVRVTFIPGEQFQNAMSPWFQPNDVPQEDEHLVRVLAEPEVAMGVKSLGVRYVIGLNGAANREDSQWGGCVGGYAGAACVGGMGSRNKVRVSATILDVKAGEVAGRIDVQGSGKNEVGMLVLVPYVWVTPTQSQVCKAFSDRIASVVRGKQLAEVAE